jgi:hypothetical protein
MRSVNYFGSISWKRRGNLRSLKSCRSCCVSSALKKRRKGITVRRSKMKVDLKRLKLDGCYALLEIAYRDFLQISHGEVVLLADEFREEF